MKSDVKKWKPFMVLVFSVLMYKNCVKKRKRFVVVAVKQVRLMKIMSKIRNTGRLVPSTYGSTATQWLTDKATI